MFKTIFKNEDKRACPDYSALHTGRASSNVRLVSFLFAGVRAAVGYM